jgi:hypothetical protein
MRSTHNKQRSPSAPLNGQPFISSTDAPLTGVKSRKIWPVSSSTTTTTATGTFIATIMGNIARPRRRVERVAHDRLGVNDDRHDLGCGQRLAWSEVRCRPMTMRWIWLVPSKICMTFTSRRGTGSLRSCRSGDDTAPATGRQPLQGRRPVAPAEPPTRWPASTRRGSTWHVETARSRR